MLHPLQVCTKQYQALTRCAKISVQHESNTTRLRYAIPTCKLSRRPSHSKNAPAASTRAAGGRLRAAAGDLERWTHSRSAPQIAFPFSGAAARRHMTPRSRGCDHSGAVRQFVEARCAAHVLFHRRSGAPGSDASPRPGGPKNRYKAACNDIDGCVPFRYSAVCNGMEIEMGRPPIGKTAMTGAERVRRYRRKHGTDKPVTKRAVPVTKPTGPDHAALVRELAQLKAELAQAKPLFEAELAQAKAQAMALVETELAQGQAKAGADVTRLEAEIAALRDENYAFRVELEARNRVFKTRAGGGLTNAQYRLLQKLGHPDDPLSEKNKNEAIRLINQLRYVLCNEAELPSMDPKKYSTQAQRLWARRQEEIKEVKRHTKRRSQPKPSPRSPKGLPKTQPRCFGKKDQTP
jgi:hypothetical protein